VNRPAIAVARAATIVEISDSYTEAPDCKLPTNSVIS